VSSFLQGPFRLDIAIALFVLFTAENILYVKYFQAVSAHRAGLAAVYSTLIYVVSITGVLGYVSNAWYAAPVLVGAAIGTYFGVRLRGNLTVKE
jgi:hypothetical protein